MVDQRIKDTFSTTYRDDYADSAGFHKILFNNGRAVQARELTQLQTIIQSEITRFGNNIFVEGAAVNPGKPTVTNYQFVKLDTSSNTLPTDTSTLIDVVFTGQTSGIKAKIVEVVEAEGSDPATLFVVYTDGKSDGSQTLFSPAEDISNGSITLTVQTTNTSVNPAIGQGLLAGVPGGDFYATGRFVYAPKQTKILSKYSTDVEDDLGFQIFEEIVTANDDISLYDNSGDLPNTSSPGADRYKIRLVLDIRSNMDSDANFVYIAKIRNGQIISDVEAESPSNYNVLTDVMAKRTEEESGDYIVKPFTLAFDNDSDLTNLDITVSPGTVYVDGYRASQEFHTTLTVSKPRTTATVNNEVIAYNVGNYVVVNGNKGLPNIDTFALLNLRSATGHGGSTIGTARVRAIEEGQGANYNLYLFDIQMSNNENFRSVRSIGTSTSDYWDLVLELSQAVLKDAGTNSLLFSLPSNRPSSIADISVATQRRFTTSTNGSGEATLTLTASGETFANTNDWLVALADSDLSTSHGISGSGTTTASLTGLPVSEANLEVIGYVNKSAASVRSKTLNETTITISSFDSDGNGLNFAYLDHADVYSFESIKAVDSDGDSIVGNFTTDNGQRDNFYDKGRIVLKAGKSIPSGDVFVRYKYFSHGATGDFFAVNSYTGQVDYENIPTHTLRNGTKVELRDVIDFRPVVNSSRTFGSGAIIHELPQTNDTVQSDITYYKGKNIKLIMTTNSELKIVEGEENLNPQFPDTPPNSIELYRIELNPYTLSPQDISTRKLDYKRYTMADIGRLENRINSLEELTSLSLLELDTSSLLVLDSAGSPRTKSGFLVDNFKDHAFSDVTNDDYRAALDPINQHIRPRGLEDAAMLQYDSASSTNTILRGDNVYLNYNHRLHINQSSVTGTENVNPFIKMGYTGSVQLSPSSDSWIEQQYIADRVISGGTNLNSTNGNLWNSAGWNWNGTPVDQLSVGSTTNTQSSSSTSTATTGTRATGTTTTQTTVTNSTSNVVVSSQTITSVIGDRIVNILVIPFMRSRKIYFKAEGLRPNTKLFPFFDGVRVDNWVKAETYVNVSTNPVDVGNTQNNATGHPDGSSAIIADATGKIEGSFFIPSTDNLKFRTGTRTFTLSDVTNTIQENGTSYGRTTFTSTGALEIRQRDILSTRVLTVASTASTSSTNRVIGRTPAARQVIDRGMAGDPLAQSFFIDQSSGVFATKFDVYYATKASSDSRPTWIELRPMLNGAPTNEVIPGSVVFAYPSSITTSTDASVATTFEFDEPIYLQGYKEYALIVRADTTEYEVYISKVGDFVLGTTDKKVTKQPFLGSLFKSQNASTWTPSQWEDLTFKMHVAQFTATTGTAILNNVALPGILLPDASMSVDSADATITVSQPNHGLTVGDDVVISGAVGFAGISSSSLNGTRTITALDATGYTFEADSSSTSALSGGGDAVIATKNIPMDIIIPQITTLAVDNTTINVTGEFTTGQSLAGTETAYQKESAIDLGLNRQYVFTAPHLIANATNETNNMSGNKSLTFNLTMSTSNDYVSPVIDMQRAGVITIKNQIDRQIESPASGFNVPLNYVAETSSSGGTHAAKHITIPISLAENAVGIKTIIAANRPSVASFDVYYRTTEGEGLSNSPWILATLDNNMPSDENPSIFRNYEYTIGGQGGTLAAFNQFQLKIVMKSSNSSKVPVIKDLRAIALGT